LEIGKAQERQRLGGDAAAERFREFALAAYRDGLALSGRYENKPPDPVEWMGVFEEYVQSEHPWLLTEMVYVCVQAEKCMYGSADREECARAGLEERHLSVEEAVAANCPGYE
jgi:hypothetical protein